MTALWDTLRRIPLLPAIILVATVVYIKESKLPSNAAMEPIIAQIARAVHDYFLFTPAGGAPAGGQVRLQVGPMRRTTGTARMLWENVSNGQMHLPSERRDCYLQSVSIPICLERMLIRNWCALWGAPNPMPRACC